jgi:hypothetical protein
MTAEAGHMASVAVPIAKRLVGGQVVAIDIQPGMLIRPQEKSRREALVRETALGFHIVGFREARANKRLQATRETRAPAARRWSAKNELRSASLDFSRSRR